PITTIAAGALASLAASLALATAGTASADETTSEQTYPVGSGQDVEVEIYCPNNVPALMKAIGGGDHGSIPSGVEVLGARTGGRFTCVSWMFGSTATHLWY
ncbi:MAG TPA: hypothetical protein VFQ37_09445, partial [Mycobacterium sp.]|nr:hypothetical protein [Mycobacterium sp.]